MKHFQIAAVTLTGIAFLIPNTSFASGSWTPSTQETRTFSNSQPLINDTLNKNAFSIQNSIRRSGNRHVSTQSDEDDARRQRLLNYTRNRNTGQDRVKSAKENFKKNLGNNTSTSSRTTSNKRTFRRPSIRSTESSYQKRPLRTFTNTARRSSFNFVPQARQIWGR